MTEIFLAYYVGPDDKWHIDMVRGEEVLLTSEGYSKKANCLRSAKNIQGKFRIRRCEESKPLAAVEHKTPVTTGGSIFTQSVSSGQVSFNPEPRPVKFNTEPVVAEPGVSPLARPADFTSVDFRPTDDVDMMPYSEPVVVEY